MARKEKKKATKSSDIIADKPTLIFILPGRESFLEFLFISNAPL